MKPLILVAAIGLLATAPGSRSTAEGAHAAQANIVAIDNTGLHLSPYTWKFSGKGPAARAEAAMPGAYLEAAFQGSTTVGLVIDATANRGCPAPSMPVIEFSIDGGPYRVVPLTRADTIYTLPMADGLDLGRPHWVALYFRAADLTRARWTSPATHLRLAGLTLDATGTLLPFPARARRAIGFGDSITEGVGVDGLFTSWQKLGVNNARGTWLPIACAALGCEYGQLGSGGQGMTREIELPPLTRTWDRYDPTTTQLTGGRLLPEPDFVFCAHGTNDFDKDITADYTRWLTAICAACPHARFFCVVPLLGVHEAEIRAAVEARHRSGDPRVHLVETSPLRHAFRANQGATRLAHDGVHPSGHGQALLGDLIAVEVQKVLTGSTAR